MNMVQRIFPSWEQMDQYKEPLRSEERRLLENLDYALSRDERWRAGDKIADYNGWLIFSRPFFNGYSPDVVIFHPFKGIVIYDLFDGDVLSYAYQNTDDSRMGFRERVSGKKALLPYKKVEDIVDFFKGNIMPEVGEAFTRSARGSLSPVIGVTVFTKNSWDDVDGVFFPKDKKQPPVPKWILLPGAEYLQYDREEDLLPSAFASEKLVQWDNAWSLKSINWIKPPLHSIEHASVLSIRGNQLKVATPAPGHHRVRGVAGSGKTQALAYRAAQLASMGYDVLVLSFNITMWHFMRDMIDRAPFEFEWSRITFNHFHGFCNRILKQFQVPWPTSEANDEGHDELFTNRVPNRVREVVAMKQHQKYDAILIDEGQDFQFEWYSLLNDCFLSERDEVVVVCDKRQNIYKCDNSWLDRRVTRSGMDKFNHPFIELRRTYRLPAPIASMANDFAKTFGMNSEVSISEEFDACLFDEHQCHIEWKSWRDVSIERTASLSPEEDEKIKASEERERDKVCRRLYSWYVKLNGRYGNPSDIVILVPDHKWGKVISEYFTDKGVESNNIFGSSGKGKKVSFNMEDPRLKICTIHSFKGWEMRNVLIFIPERLSANASEQNVRVSDANGNPCINMDSLLYTAMTRVKQNLVVFNEHPRYKSFGRRYKKLLPFKNVAANLEDEDD